MRKFIFRIFFATTLISNAYMADGTTGETMTYSPFEQSILDALAPYGLSADDILFSKERYVGLGDASPEREISSRFKLASDEALSKIAALPTEKQKELFIFLARYDALPSEGRPRIAKSSAADEELNTGLRRVPTDFSSRTASMLIYYGFDWNDLRLEGRDQLCVRANVLIGLYHTLDVHTFQSLGEMMRQKSIGIWIDAPNFDGIEARNQIVYQQVAEILPLDPPLDFTSTETVFKLKAEKILAA